MQLDAARIVLRPRRLSELLDLALRYAGHEALGFYLRLALVSLIPGAALCIAAYYGLGWEWTHVWIAAVVVARPLQGIYTIAIGRGLFAEELTVREVLTAYLARLPAYLGTLLISRIVSALFWPRSLYVHEACLLERASPGTAIQRAWQMGTHDGFGTRFGLLLGLLLSQLVFVLGFEFLLNVGLMEFVFQAGKPFGALEDGGSVFALLGYFCSIPFVATARFLAYVDRRTRRDGWDIQLKFMAIEAREKGEPHAGHAGHDGRDPSHNEVAA
jgi:hypothetical protein